MAINKLSSFSNIFSFSELDVVFFLENNVLNIKLEIIIEVIIYKIINKILMNFQKIGYFSHMLNGWIAYIKIIFFDVKIGKKIIEPKINRKNEKIKINL